MIFVMFIYEEIIVVLTSRSSVKVSSTSFSTSFLRSTTDSKYYNINTSHDSFQSILTSVWSSVPYGYRALRSGSAGSASGVTLHATLPADGRGVLAPVCTDCSDDTYLETNVEMWRL